MACLLLAAAGCQTRTQPVVIRVGGGVHDGPVPNLSLERRGVGGAATQPWQAASFGSNDSGVAIPYLPGRHVEDARFSAPDYGPQTIRIDWDSNAVAFEPAGPFYPADSLPPIRLDFHGTAPEDLEIVRLYADWGAILKEIVAPGGWVRWDLVKGDPRLRDTIVRVTNQVAGSSPDNRPGLFRESPGVWYPVREWAYWINVYNALSIVWVIEHDFPATVSSARNEPFQVGGRAMTLDQIAARAVENPVNKAALFAMSACARSSPPLRNEPYVGGRLEQQEAEQARAYLRDRRAVLPDGDTIRLNDLILNARRKLSVPIQAQLQYAYPDWTLLWELHDMAGDSPGNPFPSSNPARQSGVKIGRLGFDWSLNSPPSASGHPTSGSGGDPGNTSTE